MRKDVLAMRRIRCLALASAILAAPNQAAAFMVAPDEERAGRYFVLIDRASGDHVPLDALPPPYSVFGGTAWTDQQGLTFRWRYFRSPERGSATLTIDEADGAAVSFGFSGDNLSEGDTVAAAVVFIGEQGEAVGTAYAAARVSGSRFAGGQSEYHATAPLPLTGVVREAITGFTVLTMKYYALQELDGDAVAAAMRRAVARVTGGDGFERWAQPP